MVTIKNIFTIIMLIRDQNIQNIGLLCLIMNSRKNELIKTEAFKLFNGKRPHSYCGLVRGNQP